MADAAGVSRQQLLAGSRISPALLADPDGEVPGRDAGRLVRRLAQLSGMESVGIEYGLRVRPTTHGLFGYAMMSCTRLDDLVHIGRKYLARQLRDFSFHLDEQGERVALRVDANSDFGSLRRVYFEALLVAACENMFTLIGRQADGVTVSVDWPEPAYFAQYAPRLTEWRFSCARNEISFPRALLDSPLIMADPEAVERALRQLDIELAARGARQGRGILPRVRAMLEQAPGSYPALADVAGRLHMSERTLKRRLQEAGTSFKILLQDARLNQAGRLLRAGKLSVQDISMRLGYTDPASFTRAFKRWTGRRPSDDRLR